MKDILCSKEIDVLLMQEKEIESEFDCELLRIPGYVLEMENNTNERRVGIYVKNNLNYVRLSRLEGQNNHLVIIELKEGHINNRIINIYRSSNPFEMTQKDLFKRQCDRICNAFNPNTVIMGDFNLDFNILIFLTY